MEYSRPYKTSHVLAHTDNRHDAFQTECTQPIFLLQIENI
jgi:hypothetical protein